MAHAWCHSSTQKTLQGTHGPGCRVVVGFLNFSLTKNPHLRRWGDVKMRRSWYRAMRHVVSLPFISLIIHQYYYHSLRVVCSWLVGKTCNKGSSSSCVLVLSLHRQQVGTQREEVARPRLSTALWHVILCPNIVQENGMLSQGDSG